MRPRILADVFSRRSRPFCLGFFSRSKFLFFFGPDHLRIKPAVAGDVSVAARRMTVRRSCILALNKRDGKMAIDGVIFDAVWVDNKTKRNPFCIMFLIFYFYHTTLICNLNLEMLMNVVYRACCG